ncbi:MAG TPA: hypothetical protein PLR99_21700 [Polyangiaceae bacterium]|nr:hypothetical protein [Polyangiaceae bacterium]
MTRLSAVELPAMSPAAAVRVVRALGANRYVLGRLHEVHAFVFAAAGARDALAEAQAWAARVLADPTIDRDSKDPALFRATTDKELVAALGAFWGDAAEGEARARLVELLRSVGAAPGPGPLFDEGAEDDVYPVLIDAGWELLPLARLEPERHRGVLESYTELELAAARFEEESAIPPRAHLLELPIFGGRELVLPEDEWGDLRAPLVVWSSLDATYEDYLVRGVLRAAKVEPLG